MFFDESLGNKLSKLAQSFVNSGSKKEILVGDPGRWLLSEQKMKKGLKCLAKYDLGTELKQEHFGLLHGLVYSFQGQKSDT